MQIGINNHEVFFPFTPIERISLWAVLIDALILERNDSERKKILSSSHIILITILIMVVELKFLFIWKCSEQKYAVIYIYFLIFYFNIVSHPNISI